MVRLSNLLKMALFIIHDSEGQFFAGVAAPWAKDANGADVPTRYEVWKVFAPVNRTGVIAY